MEWFPDSEIERLTSFLLDRVAEDEESARSASPAPWRPAASGFQVLDRNGTEAATAFALTGHEQRGNAVHIARHDPARVRAECAAKRLILAHCREALRNTELGEDRRTARSGWDVMCALALPYAGHPQFRADWRSLICAT